MSKITRDILLIETIKKSDSSLESSFYEYQRTFPWQSYNLECNFSFALCEKPCGDHY